MVVCFIYALNLYTQQLNFQEVKTPVGIFSGFIGGMAQDKSGFIVPQDIGKVILNLLTNAFDAVKEKKRQQPDNYEPTILLSTRKEGDQVVIRVKDNGNGITEAIRDKIFQPFFTTKPAGQGTGLGLSLAYDIVKKHGRTITVNSFNSPKGGPPGSSIDVISNYHEPGVLPIAIGTIGRKVETATVKEGEGSEFIIKLPIA